MKELLIASISFCNAVWAASENARTEGTLRPRRVRAETMRLGGIARMAAILSCWMIGVFAFCPASARGSAELILTFGDGARVAIHVADKQVRAVYRDPAHTGRSIVVTPAFTSMIRSGSVRFLMGEHSVQSGLAMLVSSAPSKQTGGTGFCGAGSEDYAVLVQNKNNVLAIADRYLLQSCLHSITLDAAEPDDILGGLIMDDAAFSLTFSRFDNPPKPTITLGVRDAKFFKEEAALSPASVLPDRN